MTNTQEILFGWDATEGIVAVETGDKSARIYRRVGSEIVTENRDFRRWILTTKEHILADAQWTELEGEGYRYLAEFPDGKSYNTARYWLRDSHADHIAYPSATRQYLTRSGQTLFKGMAFDDVVRLQLDLETLALRPDQPENAIFLAAISDNRGFERLISGDEQTIIRETIDCIKDRDPDIIEGHNILGFDLPYLAARAQMHGIRLGIGRDGSDISFSSQQNCMIGYYSRPYVPAHIHGRQVIDTLLAVQRFDVAKGNLASHGLKAVAQTLGIAEEQREYIAHERIADEWRTNPERVKMYAMQDVRETRSLAALVCPPEFYLTEMVPDTYSRTATSGTGEKINYIFIRSYLKHGRAIPKQAEPKPLPGGYTEVRTTGLIENVVKCDVESLYPSIMHTQNIKPESDELDIFIPALQELTQRRIKAKRMAKDTDGKTRQYWDGLQGAFKILINSFYGYLGGPFNFNDYDAAAQVTTTGQSIVKKIVEELEKTGSVVVEVDTDGVYFKPPAGVDNEEKEMEYISRIDSTLPEGIHLAHDGRYKAMISLKIKNYILAPYDGVKIFKGSSLRSRSDEPFGLEFISNAADYLLQGKKELVKELYESIAQQIETGKLNIERFARRERITEKTFTSTAKKRLAQAAGQAKVGDYVTIYQRSDGSIGLAENYANDEDQDYLLDKLYKFACRLKEALGEDFDSMFPKPSSKSKRKSAEQQTLGLFD